MGSSPTPATNLSDETNPKPDRLPPELSRFLPHRGADVQVVFADERLEIAIKNVRRMTLPDLPAEEQHELRLVLAAAEKTLNRL